MSSAIPGPRRRRARPRAWRPRAGLAALFVALLLSAACEGDGHTPVLHELSYDGQAPDSDLVLLLTARFSDPDGDLGEGFFETFINGRPSSLGQLALRPIFLWNGVELDATEGELEFFVELALVSPLEESSTFDLGVRAVDGQGNASELKEVRLEVTELVRTSS